MSVKLAVVLAFGALGCTCEAGPRRAAAPTPTPTAFFGPPQTIALAAPADLREISGIAASRRADDRYWVHQDSGNPPDLFAIDGKGARVGHVRVGHVRDLDWEDIDGFVIDGKPYLLIADTGDNGAVRPSVELVVVEEPELPADQRTLTVEPAWTIRFRYPGGPRDCEAVAIDAEQDTVYLLSKRTVPAELYTLPLRRPANDAEQVAKPAGVVAGIPQPTAAERATGTYNAAYGAQPTGMDMAGRRAVLLTYRHAYLIERAGAETWSQAFQRLRQIPLPLLPQAEAIAFDRAGGSILVGSENAPTLLRLPPAPAP